MHLLKAANDNTNNNLNLLRFFAATVVFLDHCFPLTGQREPILGFLGMTLGAIAVDVFFVISGFLVTKSLLKSNNSKSFLLARVLRIYPGLTITIVLTIVLGAFFTSLPLIEYLKNAETIRYFVKGVTLLAGVEMQLPGVFATTPFPNAVNGSLWTLIYEVKMYLLLLILWKVSHLVKHKYSTEQVLAILFPSLLVLAFVYFTYRLVLELPVSHLNRFFFLFFSGATFYLFRKFVYLRKWHFWTILTLLLVLSFVSNTVFRVTYLLVIPHLVMYLSFEPKGKIRRFNDIGDYSYGIYIYSFPIQQTVVALFPKINSFEMMVICYPFILVFALLSWHGVERKFLTLKKQN